MVFADVNPIKMDNDMVTLWSLIKVWPYQKISKRLFDEGGASMVEATLAIPILNFIFFGYVIFAYTTILLMGAINNAGVATLNFMALRESSWSSITNGKDLVINPDKFEQMKIGSYIEQNRFYDYENTRMVGFANVLGGLVKRNSGVYYMKDPDSSTIKGTTVDLSMSIVDQINPEGTIEAKIKRYSPLVKSGVSAAINIPID